MMNLKRLTALLLMTTVTVGAFAGCGSSKDSSDKSAESSQNSTEEKNESEEATDGAEETVAKGGKVEFWNDKLSNIDQTQMDTVVETIQSASGHELELSMYPDTASYQTAVQQTIRDKKAPGLFTWWSGSQLETLVENGLVEDMTSVWEDCIFDSGVSQGVADAFTFDGKIYAAPWSVLYNVVIYNKNVFEEYSLEEPTTFEEFLNVCETLKSNGVTPISLKSDSWSGFIWFQQLLAAKDVELYNGICDGSIKYTDPRVVEVMELWQDMLEKGYFSVPTDYGDVKNAIAKGEIAMMLEPHVEFTFLKNDYGVEEGKDLDAFVVPSMDGGKGTIFFEASPLCVSTASAQKDDALDLLQSWYTEDVQNMYNKEFGYTNTSKITVETPVVQEILKNTGDKDNYQLVLRYYENTPEELRDAALDELMKFQLQNANAEETLNAIQTKADEFFGN